MKCLPATRGPRPTCRTAPIPPIAPIALLGLLVACAAPAVAQADIERYLAPAADRLAAAAPDPLVLGFGTFTFAEMKAGSSFSRYLEEALSTVLMRQGRFELFSRARLDQVLAAQELSLSDMVDQKTAVPAGRLKGVQVLLSGTFFEAGTGVRLFLELLSVETGTVMARAEAMVPKAAIPASVSILPDNYDDARYVREQLAAAQPAPAPSEAAAGAFAVRAWSVRGDGGTYRDGENLVVSFHANRDGFIKIYHVDVQKMTRLIFPNQYHRDNAVRAGRTYHIPDESYPFVFALGPPHGTEFIKVVASTTQFTDIEDAFRDIGVVTSEVVTRGLPATASETQVAEATFSYTIIR